MILNYIKLNDIIAPYILFLIKLYRIISKYMQFVFLYLFIHCFLGPAGVRIAQQLLLSAVGNGVRVAIFRVLAFTYGNILQKQEVNKCQIQTFSCEEEILHAKYNKNIANIYYTIINKCNL